MFLFKIFLSGIALVSCLSLFSQNNENNIIPCIASEIMEDGFKKDPVLRQKYNLIQSQLDLEYKDALRNQQQKKSAATVYTVPVVFHVLHQGGAENVSDAEIISALDQVNKDFRKGGADVSMIHPSFAPIYKDAEIQFALAKKDPNGNCTNGIIRHLDPNTDWTSDNFAAFAYSGTGAGKWPTNKYLNVYIVKCIAGLGFSCPASGGVLVGYTYLPGSSPGVAADAIVYRYDYLSGLRARSLSHEIGHWLNLMHTWGGGSVASACGDDGVPDTPETQGFYSSCPGLNAGPFSGCSVVENIENFMDYSSCPKMFTQDQVTRMRAALTSAIGGRNNLWTSANHDATGLSSSFTCLPIADFRSNLAGGCVGQTINYVNLSNVGLSGSFSWTFEGGSPTISTSNSPSVTYATPGTYSVGLTATNGAGSNTINKISYITISKSLGWVTMPDFFDFDLYYGVPYSFTVKNYDSGSVAWDYYSEKGALSTPSSMFLHNAAQPNSANHIDAFETAVYNFENTTGASLSYYYAYAKNFSTQVDSFKVQYSLDCGGTWINIIGIPSAVSMAANSGGVKSGDYVPMASDWKQHIVPSSLLTALDKKPSVKFRFYFKSDPKIGSSNNIYIDQINLSGIVGLNELENSIGLTIYPNPTNSSSVLEFNLDESKFAKIKVTDVTGRMIVNVDPLTSINNKVVYTINHDGDMPKGIYFITIEIDGLSVTKKIIIN